MHDHCIIFKVRINAILISNFPVECSVVSNYMTFLQNVTNTFHQYNVIPKLLSRSLCHIIVHIIVMLHCQITDSITSFDIVYCCYSLRTIYILIEVLKLSVKCRKIIANVFFYTEDDSHHTICSDCIVRMLCIILLKVTLINRVYLAEAVNFQSCGLCIVCNRTIITFKLLKQLFCLSIIIYYIVFLAL